MKDATIFDLLVENQIVEVRRDITSYDADGCYGEEEEGDHYWVSTEFGIGTGLYLTREQYKQWIQELIDLL